MLHRMPRFARRVMLASLLAVGLPGSALAQGAPSYSGFTLSQCIPFAAPTTGAADGAPKPAPFTLAPTLKFRVEGSKTTHKVQMDTGSVGLVMSSGLIPNFATLAKQPSAAPGWQFLSSSKILWSGTWVKRSITLLGEGEVPVAIAEVPVLGVQQQTTCPQYKAADQNTCPPPPDNSQQAPGEGVVKDASQLGIVYMGVGFGQEADFQPQGTPDKNVLLNLKSLGGQPVGSKSFNRGYIIGTRGVTVGLTHANTTGFKFIKLDRYCDPSVQKAGSLCPPALAADWQSPSMCVSVNGQKCVNGRLLVDTGIPQSYLDIPKRVTYQTAPSENASTKQAAAILANTTQITIKLPEDIQPIVTTGFTIGNKEAIEPLQVIPWSWEQPYAFLNTGRHFLRAWQFLYDADHGYVGLKPAADTCGG
jgi:hypothetical protein